MTLFCGVDGGGSKTLAVVVAENGREVGRGTAGTTNYQVVMSQGNEAHAAAKIVAERISSAILAAVPAVAPTFGAVFCGLAGASRPPDFAMLKSALVETKLCHPAKWQIVNDAELILYGLPSNTGVGLIAGTGSIAVGRNANGVTARAGGWGYLYGDEGSGYQTGIAALHAASQAADGRGDTTILLEMIMRQWNLTQPEELIKAVYSVTDGRNQKIAQLAGLVYAAAREGDKVAADISRQAARDLAKTAFAVYRKLGFSESPPIGLGGGLLLNTPELQAALIQNLTELGYTPAALVPVAEPALAAALAARKLDE
jgi:N-acetylglucosamine kinase-like BadF-type ATPase